MKYHHCLLDGMAGASLATARLDLDPDADGPLVPFPSEVESRAGDVSTLDVVGGVAQRWLTGPRRQLAFGSVAMDDVRRVKGMAEAMGARRIQSLGGRCGVVERLEQTGPQPEPARA